jgi:lysophospholipase L1-like esterase
MVTSISGASAAGKAATQQSTPLPRVLLIGDSICGGYEKGVKKLLAGKAEVVKNAGNAEHTGTGLAKIDEWLGDGKWDVIHFNWGLWDMYGWQYAKEDHSPAAYEKRLEELVTRMEKTGAKLIWATTTPACPEPEGTMLKRFKTELKITPQVEQQYLDAALRVMKKHNVQVNDLHALMAPELSKYLTAPDNVHFTGAGYAKLGKQVADSILQQLSTPDKDKPKDK